MKFNQSGNTFFLYIEKDEPVYRSIIEFCKNHHIKNGKITGIGAVKNAEIGAYNQKTKAYTKNTFRNTLELVSLTGNITIKDGEPFLHAHVVLGNQDSELVGGHLFEMTIAVVGEFILETINTTIKRSMDPDIELATWDLD
jgi:predicted DNA-binding protein with PD1-like motif